MSVNLGDIAPLDHFGDELIEENVQHVGLADIDENKFDDMNFNGTNLLVHIRDDGEAGMPSLKFSTGIFVALWLGLVVVAMVVVCLIVYCSRKHEMCLSKKVQGKAASHKKMEGSVRTKMDLIVVPSVNN